MKIFTNNKEINKNRDSVPIKKIKIEIEFTTKLALFLIGISLSVLSVLYCINLFVINRYQISSNFPSLLYDKISREFYLNYGEITGWEWQSLKNIASRYNQPKNSLEKTSKEIEEKLLNLLCAEKVEKFKKLALEYKKHKISKEKFLEKAKEIMGKEKK